MPIVNNPPGVLITRSDHFVIDRQQGSFSYDDGLAYYTIARPANDGRGITYGSGHGSISMILGNDGRFVVAHSEEPPQLLDSPTRDTPYDQQVTEIIQDTIWIGTGVVHKNGVQVVEGGVDFRILYATYDDVVLAETCTQEEWDGRVRRGEGMGYGGIETTVANTMTLANLVHDWPVYHGTEIRIIYQFKEPVTVMGYGTIGVDWHVGWQDEVTFLDISEVVYYPLYIPGSTFAFGDIAVFEGIPYRCKVAGTQTGTLLDNIASWKLLSDPFTFQETYNEEPDGRIITDSTTGAIKLRRGSAADTDLVLDIENGAGTSTCTVDGNGAVVAASIKTNNTSIATKKLVVTSAATSQGTVTIAHGLTVNSIVGLSAVACLDSTHMLPHNAGTGNNDEFFVSIDDGDVTVHNSGINITEKEIRITIIYEV